MIEELQDRKERLDASPRLTELDRLFTSLSGQIPLEVEGIFNALSLLIVEASLDADEAALDYALGGLQHVAALHTQAAEQDAAVASVVGRLLGILDVTISALDRVPPLGFLVEFEESSHAHAFLKLLADGPGRSNIDVAAQLAVDPSQASRIGSRLVESGLARRRRVGRTNRWEIAPRGVLALRVLDEGGFSRPRPEHRQLQT